VLQSRRDHFRLLAVFIFLSASGPLRCLASVPGDSLELLGAWRWVRSAGGWGADRTPPPSGWSRFLYFQKGGTYSYWEEDSIRKYRVNSGKFTVHGPGSARPFPWIEFENGWDPIVGGAEGREWLRFVGRDTLTLYPGGGDRMVSDMDTHTFIRENGRPVPIQGISMPGLPWRPTRLLKYMPGAYWAELPPTLGSAISGVQPLHEWNDWAYASLLPASYRYTNYQIPSAIVGDFDGDSLVDVAIHGWNGKTEDRVACLLSNYASPRGLMVVTGPVSFEPEHHGPGPPLYLELLPAGQAFVDSLGNRVTIRTDAIRVIPTKGQAAIYYYKDGTFHRGRPIDLPPPDSNR